MRSKSVSPIVWCIVLAGIMLALAACDSKEPPASGSNDASQPSQPASPEPAAAQINAADFFTRADAEAVLGQSVGEPAVRNSGITSNVTYIAADFSGIGLFVRASTTARAFDEAQAASKSILGADPVPIEGLGEKAYWSGGKVNQLNVFKSGHWLIVTIPMGGDKSLDLAKLAAGKALARIP